MNTSERLGTLRKKIEHLGYGAYLVTDEMNVKYLTGIPTPQAPFLLVRPDGKHVLYVMNDALRLATEKVGNECDVKAAYFYTGASQSTFELFLSELPRLTVKRLGFDTLSAEAYMKLREKAKETTLVPDRHTMWTMRMIKSGEEIEAIRRAAKIADEGERTAAEIIRPGMREDEVAAEVEHSMRVAGSELGQGIRGHPTAVYSGPRSYMGMFGDNTDRKIGKDEFVIVDVGARVNGYLADLARTYVAGKPTARQEKIYNLVNEAWSAAFACVKPGANGGEVDAAARKVFGGEEKFFNHEGGHGVGLSIPEPPALVKNSTDNLSERMVVTVEPGIYFEDIGGAIIEDTVLVVKDGAERLTAPPMELEH
jgi:Xaa-Pro aminopeptidase